MVRRNTAPIIRPLQARSKHAQKCLAENRSVDALAGNALQEICFHGLRDYEAWPFRLEVQAALPGDGTAVCA